MTLNRFETMHALIGPRKELNITYKNPDETLQGTPTVLGTTEPGGYTFSYTVDGTNHLPVLDLPEVTYQNTCFVMASGRNLTASNQTLNYRVLKKRCQPSNGNIDRNCVTILDSKNQKRCIYWSCSGGCSRS